MAAKKAKRIESVRQTVPIDSIAPHPENPRRGDVEAIKRSIRKNGMYVGCVVQRSTGLILVGNHRWQAAKELGLLEVDADFIDVDDETAKRILVADNRHNEIAGWDDSSLASLLQEIQSTSGLEGTGFSDLDLEKLLDEIRVPDFQPDDDAPQSTLDGRAKVTCPECGHEFAP